MKDDRRRGSATTGSADCRLHRRRWIANRSSSRGIPRAPECHLTAMSSTRATDRRSEGRSCSHDNGLPSIESNGGWRRHRSIGIRRRIRFVDQAGGQMSRSAVQLFLLCSVATTCCISEDYLCRRQLLLLLRQGRGRCHSLLQNQ
jgi:hypothetical protein